MERKSERREAREAGNDGGMQGTKKRKENKGDTLERGKLSHVNTNNSKSEESSTLIKVM